MFAAETIPGPEDHKSFAYLGCDSSGSIHCIISPKGAFSCIIGCNFFASISSCNISYELTPQKVVRQFVCRKWQLRRFVHEGYLHVPNIVDRVKISRCRAFLNRCLGDSGHSLVPGGVQGQAVSKFAGGVSNSNEVSHLLEGPLSNVVGDFLGPRGYDRTNLGAQIAFRFPESATDYDCQWHTDGLRQGKDHPFRLYLVR